MGKKKSKVSKQKQAKAKNRQTSLGGVTVSKGSSSKFQHSRNEQTTSVTLHVNNRNKGPYLTKNVINQKDLTEKLSENSGKPKVFFSPSSTEGGTSVSGRVLLQPRLGSIREDQEQQDFDQQFASLQERQWMVDHKKTGGRKRGNRKAGKSDSFYNASTSGVMLGNVTMQPASFRVEKNTQELLQETMQRMVHMTGVGISSFESTPIRSNKKVEPEARGVFLPQPPNVLLSSASHLAPQQAGVSSLAVALQRQHEQQNELIQEHNSQNPYHALGMGDSDDEESGGNNGVVTNSDWSLKVQPALNLNFAPASFSLMPRQSPTPASTPIPIRRQQPLGMQLPPIQSCSLVATFLAAGATANADTNIEDDFDPDL